MTAKHTPGPWKYEPATGAILRGDTDGYVLAQVTGYDAEDDEEQANALLMTASPDLFAALVEMVEGNTTPETWDRARAAIAAARGER